MESSDLSKPSKPRKSTKPSKPRAKKSLDQQINETEAHLKSLHRKKAAESFDVVIAKHQQAINAIYSDLKNASGKKRGIDVEILGVVAAAMGMKGMIITKNVVRKK